MEEKWEEISYNKFPSFISAFQRSNYEMWDVKDDADIIIEETEEMDCWDWKSRYMSIR